MSLYDLKPKFQNLLRPLVIKLEALGVSANGVTLSAALISLIVGLGLSVWGPSQPLLFLALPLWSFVRMAMNAIDGMLAREMGQQSSLGAYYNELCDVVSDAALLLPFAFLPGCSPALIYALIFLAVLAEYAGVLGCLVGAGRQYAGPSGKADRALLFGVVGLLFAVTGSLPAWINLLFAGSAVAMIVTTLNRIRHGLRLADSKKSLSSQH